MLNRKQNITVFTSLLLFFFSHLAFAGFSPLKHTPFTSHTASILAIRPFAAIPDSSISRIEIPLHPSISSFVKNYHKNFDDFFEKLKQNKLHQLNSIEKALVQSGVPAEMKYLAIVESKLNTNALSGCGAVGLWQFMPATAKRFGLKIIDNNDERKNVWKSSIAAAKYLKYLHSFFDDWLLVVAAYNSGPAPVLKAIKRSGSRNFWQLQYFLPKETRMHVKRFIATHFYFEGNGSLVTMGKKETETFYALFTETKDKNKTEETSVRFHFSTGRPQKWVSVFPVENKIYFLPKI
jgi:membrane-bound lytic murein transglycosylase D